MKSNGGPQVLLECSFLKSTSMKIFASRLPLMCAGMANVARIGSLEGFHVILVTTSSASIPDPSGDILQGLQHHDCGNISADRQAAKDRAFWRADRVLELAFAHLEVAEGGTL